MNEAAVVERLGQFRSYLAVLARGQIGGRLQAKVDASDVVQLTLTRAVEAAPQFRGQNDAELASWLRQILARTLANIVRDLTRDRRDVARERSLEAELQASSVRLAGLLADPGASPSMRAMEQEHLVRLATVLEELPADQREAVERHHLRSEKLDDVAAAMGRSAAAVAGLIKRGMKRLRERMEESKKG